MRILSVESSCDENSAAVLEDGRVLSLVTVTQQVHQQFGGVVPELAGRSHLELQDANVCAALRTAGCELPEIDLIAATSGPGLVGSLLVGHSFAQSLALASDIEFASVHHMEAHLWSVEIEREPIALPFLVFLASGGHTMLVVVSGFRNYEVIGSTKDDAMGEAFDKVGKLLGLGFPAGAAIDLLAQAGNREAISFPVALQNVTFDFSFSGLKTAVAYKLRDEPSWSGENSQPDLLASFQNAAMRSVLPKIERAAREYRVRAVCAAGGVAANSALRVGLTKIAQNLSIDVAVPAMKYCADNAAMVAYAAHKQVQAGLRAEHLPVRPRWPLAELRSPAAN